MKQVFFWFFLNLLEIWVRNDFEKFGLQQTKVKWRMFVHNLDGKNKRDREADAADPSHVDRGSREYRNGDVRRQSLTSALCDTNVSKCEPNMIDSDSERQCSLQSCKKLHLAHGFVRVPSCVL